MELQRRAFALVTCFPRRVKMNEVIRYTKNVKVISAVHYFDVFKTFFTSPSCPPTVLSLVEPTIVRLFPYPLPLATQTYIEDLNVKPFRKAA